MVFCEFFHVRQSLSIVSNSYFKDIYRDIELVYIRRVFRAQQEYFFSPSARTVAVLCLQQSQSYGIVLSYIKNFVVARKTFQRNALKIIVFYFFFILSAVYFSKEQSCSFFKL